MSGPSPSPGRAYLMFTAFVSGLLVLALEVLGSRVIGPFFGVSLYVWTSLVTVTLTALALGYVVGGQIADRYPGANALYGLVLTAAGFVLLIPLIKAWVLAACVGFGLRIGALLAATALFGPALFALGCVSPLLVRLAAPSSGVLGRTVGNLSALSTLGGVIGALLTGYVLIGQMGVDAILRLCAAALMVLGIGYFAVFRRQWASVAVLLVLLLPNVSHDVQAVRMADGTEVTQVASVEGPYATVKVVDYRFGERGLREMSIDGLVQGAVDLRNGMPVYEYAYLMQYLPVLLHPHLNSHPNSHSNSQSNSHLNPHPNSQGQRALMVGLGAGIIPRWYEARGTITDVVDIDPVVVALARSHFGFQLSGDLFIADARNFIATTQRTYDYVLLDVFSGDATPGHVLTQEALREMKARLRDGGIVALNIVGSLFEDNLMTASVVRTLQSVFDHADVYPAFEPTRDHGFGNLVILAYDGASRELDRASLARMPAHPLSASMAAPWMGRRFVFAADVPAMVISDDFNPLDVHDAKLRERIRRQILDTTPWSLLLGDAGVRLKSGLAAS